MHITGVFFESGKQVPVASHEVFAGPIVSAWVDRGRALVDIVPGVGESGPVGTQPLKGRPRSGD